MKTSVLFGERAAHEDIQQLPSGLAELNKINYSNFSREDTVYHVVRIFVDREGIIYPPNMRILDSLLKGNDYTLLPRSSEYNLPYQWRIKEYLETQSLLGNNLPYSHVFQKYYGRTDHDLESLKKFREEFNRISADAIVSQIKILLNTFNYKDITFLFVGINNTFINKQTSNNSSEAKLGFQRKRIQEILDQHNYLAILQKEELNKNPIKGIEPAGVKKTLFVEVHWDGRFTSQKGLKTALNYNAGLVSSYKAGLALRPILNRLDDKELTINMMSHSSGANVICESLFNQKTKVWAHKNHTVELRQLLNACYLDTASYYNNPIQSRINAFLLEASLPGVETFQDYYARQTKKPLKNDNYRITIGYNVNDPDLGKRFGSKWIGKLIVAINYNNRLIHGLGGPFGSTSLGTLGSEIIKTRELFRKYYNVENFKDFNFSYSDANGHKAPNAFHDMASYLNLPDYRKAIRNIYGLTLGN